MVQEEEEEEEDDDDEEKRRTRTSTMPSATEATARKPIKQALHRAATETLI